MFIRLTDQISVAPQIAPEDCAVAKRRGFAAIINNRPDGEVPGQPSSAEMRVAAEAAGLRYCAIPVDHSGFSMPQIDAMAAELGAAELGAAELGAGGPVLAFCRSGTRSTNLWALAEASRGGDPDDIVTAAAAGGYDVSGLLPMLRQLGAR